jgi:hypothetical protein
MKIAVAIVASLVGGITIGALAMRAHDTRVYGAILRQTSLGTYPEHAHFYDAHNQVIRTLFYREDGTLGLAKEFDEHGKAVSIQPFDLHGNPQEKHMQQ